jgi:hypothetical protein
MGSIPQRDPTHSTEKAQSASRHPLRRIAMQVRLTTIVETIIDIDPENTENFSTAKGEIYVNNYLENEELDNIADDIKSAHQDAVIYDTVRAQSVTHSFEEVK